MKNIYVLYLLIFFCISVNAQEDKSKEFYFSAIEKYNSKNYDEALNLLEKSKNSLGSSNAYIETIKLKIYVAKKDWSKAKKTVAVIQSFKPTSDVLDEIAPLVNAIDEEDQRQFNQEMEKLKKEYKELSQTIALKEQKVKASSLIESQIKQMIEISKNIENGKPYIYTGPNLTSSPNEKSIIVFWDDQYIIFTLPSLDVLMNLNKDNISYSRYGVSDKEYDVSIEQKPYYGGNKKTIKFKKMLSQSNTYVGGFGDEIFRPLYAFEKYWEQEMLLCYYYYFNTKHADYGSFIQELDFDKDIYNPYYRTGKLNKGVDYSIVTNTELLNQLKELRYINRLEKDYSKPVGASISLNINDNFNMLLPFKQFKMEQIEIKSYIKNGVKSQDKYYHYYYRPKAGSIKTVYSIASFPSNKTLTTLENSLTLNPKDFKVSKEDFDYIYNFQEGFFTHSDFKLPYDIFINLFK